jgi:uncharacterized membrane protein
MIKFETEQTIDRSADDVWAYAADILRHPEWMGIVDARMVSGTPTTVGARATEGVKLGPSRVEVELEVSESIPGRRIGWRMLPGGAVTGEVTLDLEALGPDRTRAVWSGAMQPTGWRRFLEPLMAAEAKAGEAAELRRLKENLERALTAAAAS